MGKTRIYFSGVILHMGVSMNGSSPKWMVYKGTSHLEMDDLGAPLKMENTFEGTQNEGVLKCKSHEYYS